MRTKKIHITSFEDVLKKQRNIEGFTSHYNEELFRIRLANEIKKYRTEKKMTQGVVAKKANMPQSVIARVESGNHTFSLSTLHKIAHALGKRVELV